MYGFDENMAFKSEFCNFPLFVRDFDNLIVDDKKNK